MVNYLTMKNLLLLFIIAAIIISSCTKNHFPNPPDLPEGQKMIPVYENADVRLEVASYNLPDFSCTDLCFLNEKTGIITTSDNKIYKTVDNGLSWEMKYSYTGPDQRFYQILFVDDNNLYVVGGSVNCNGTDCTPPGGIILKSTDGGESWNTAYQDGDEQYVSITRTSDGDIFIVANYFSAPATTSSRILKSIDGGFHWTVVADVPYWLCQISFDDGYGFCTGQVRNYNDADGLIIRSSDDGNSWNDITTFSSNFTTSDVTFSENVGYFLADHLTVYKTTDHGTSWSPIYTSQQSCYSLTLSSSQDCLLLGAGHYTGGCFGWHYGAVRQTKNSGSSWTENEFSDIGPIQNASFYSSTQGYAATGILIRITVK
jgi:photosystem II stability/assembly factor-like uncharacterized protein